MKKEMKKGVEEKLVESNSVPFGKFIYDRVKNEKGSKL